MRWYAVMCKARKEQLANLNLKRQGYDTFFPHHMLWTTPKKTKPRQIIKPYLTRYIFVGLNGGPNQSIYSINSTIGVSTVVYCGYNALPIPENLITRLRALGDDKGEIPLAKKKEPDFQGKAGDRLTFRNESPLCGLIGQLRGVDKTGKLVVELENQLDSGLRITVDQSNVDKILRENADSPQMAVACVDGGVQ